MEERTLMQDICEVVQLANGSHLSDDFWGNATPLLERLGRRLDLTPVQTMLFAVLIELSDDRKIVLKQLAEFLGCRKVELLNHAADFEELIRRQLIRRRRSGSAEPDTYRIPKMVLEALQAGKIFTPPPICGLTIDQFFVRLGKLISYTSQQEMSQTELAEELQQLIDRNQQLEFCCRFREIAQSLHIWDTLVFAQCCNLYVNNRDDHIGWHDIEVLFDDEWAARCEKDALLARYSELFDLNILENAPDSGMFGNREAFRLTDKAKTTLFSEILIQLVSAQPERVDYSFQPYSEKTLVQSRGAGENRPAGTFTRSRAVQCRQAAAMAKRYASGFCLPVLRFARHGENRVGLSISTAKRPGYYAGRYFGNKKHVVRRKRETPQRDFRPLSRLCARLRPSSDSVVQRSGCRIGPPTYDDGRFSRPNRKCNAEYPIAGDRTTRRHPDRYHQFDTKP